MSPGPHLRAASSSLVHPCLLLGGETAFVTCQGTVTMWLHLIPLASHTKSVRRKPHAWLLAMPAVAEPTQGCQLQSSESAFKGEREMM